MNIEAMIAKQVRGLSDAKIAELVGNKVRVTLDVGETAPAVQAKPAAKRQPAAPKSGAQRKAAPTNGAPKGEKRTPDVLASQAKDIAEYIKRNPGHGVEVMGKALDLSTKQMQVPIRHLLADGNLRSEGTKRATKYFPGAKAAA